MYIVPILVMITYKKKKKLPKRFNEQKNYTVYMPIVLNYLFKISAYTIFISSKSNDKNSL